MTLFLKWGLMMPGFDLENLMSNYHFLMSVGRPSLFVVQFAVRGISYGRYGRWALFWNLKWETVRSGTYFLATLFSALRDLSHLMKAIVWVMVFCLGVFDLFAGPQFLVLDHPVFHFSLDWLMMVPRLMSGGPS